MRRFWPASSPFNRYMLVVAGLQLMSTAPLAAQSRGSISGTVTDSAGGWVFGAEVTVAGATGRAHTNEAGVFRLDRIPAGDATLNVRRLGYAPRSVEVRVAGSQQATVEVRLIPLALALPVIAVRERREVYDSRLAGFHSRKQRGVGHFITREQLDTRSHRLADVLREVPGVRIAAMRGAGRTIVMRGNCPALIVIDGFPATAGTFDVDMLDLASFEAIEVYSGSATIPSEFSAVRGLDRCGVVALWSRPARPRNVAAGTNRPGGEVRRMLESGAVHSADAVDQRAELIGALAPIYPGALWQGGIGGRVLLEFVVDQRGEIELGTVATVASTHAAFTAAARAVLPDARFQPAVLRGRSVRQAVQLPIEFAIPAPPNGP